MRILIVFCHPHEESYTASVFQSVQSTLVERGHELRVIDLHRENFDPVLRRDEWYSYFHAPENNIAALKDHTDALQWADALILIFPTWMYGPPAMLKGWLERVYLPGIAFRVPAGKDTRITGKLHNIRRFFAITTSGSPRWWLQAIRNPGRNFLMRGMRIMFHPRCRMEWLQLYDMDHASEQARQRFISKVTRALSKLNR